MTKPTNTDATLYVLVNGMTHELVKASFDQKVLIAFVLNDIGCDTLDDYGYIDRVPINHTELNASTNSTN